VANSIQKHHLLYKNRLVVVTTVLNEPSLKWVSTVSISSAKLNDYREFHSINDFHEQFDTQGAALEFGIVAAKAWVDDKRKREVFTS
jgi:hypothetical protein